MGIQQTQEKKFQELQLRNYELERDKSKLQEQIHGINLEQQKITTEVADLILTAAQDQQRLQGSGLTIPEIKATYRKGDGMGKN